MLSMNIGTIGTNPYFNSNANSVKNNGKVSETFSEIMAKSTINENKENSNVEKYPGDVMISNPPNLSMYAYDKSVNEKPKPEMTLDEYKQSIMNKISQFSVSGWFSSTFSVGGTVIKEEAFEAMKNDPDYEKYVLNRIRKGFSVKSLPVGHNNVGYEVIGASPEQCYGYAGPIGNNSLGNTNDGESWWDRRQERFDKSLKESIARNQKEYSSRLKLLQTNVSQIFENQEILPNLLNEFNTVNSNAKVQSQMATAISKYEKKNDVKLNAEV